MNIDVVQVGFREKYFVAKATHSVGNLCCLYTDSYIYSKYIYFAEFFNFRVVKRLLNRNSKNIPDEKVKTIGFFSSLYFSYRNSRSSTLDDYASLGEYFGGRVVKIHKLSSPVVYGYSSCSLEVFRDAKKRGAICILNQIDPGPFEWRLVKSECIDNNSPIPSLYLKTELYLKRLTQEWSLADYVVVNSNWSKHALKDYIPEQKIKVIPLFSDLISIPFGSSRYSNRNYDLNRKFKIVFLGQVSYRKGFHLLLRVANDVLARKWPVVFEIYGNIIDSSFLNQSHPSNVLYKGYVSNQDVSKVLSDADLMLFPTLSDGFGMTLLEAASCSLPVIASSRCGDVIRDGVDGFVVSPYEKELIVQLIGHYLSDPSMLMRHSSSIRNRWFDFSFGEGVNTFRDFFKSLINN